MVKGVVKICINEEIHNEYPHLIYPTTLLAEVTKGGEERVNLKVLDEHSNIDERYPEIPDVKVQEKYDTGDIVVVQLLYGKIEMPVVIKRWEP